MGGGGGGGEGEGEGEARNPARNENVNPNPNPNTNPNSPNNNNTTRGSNGRSCKGCAYYSSVHKSKSKNPTCIGFSSTLQVPPYAVATELEASKEGRSLANFYYACIGYSAYLDNKESSADSQDKAAKLPFCTGIQVLLEEKSSTSPAGHVPAHAHKTEEQEHGAHRPHPQPQPQPQTQSRRYNNNDKSPNSAAEEFLNRFGRNATLVAGGVVKNLNKAGNFVKETFVDILNWRPK